MTMLILCVIDRRSRHRDAGAPHGRAAGEDGADGRAGRESDAERGVQPVCGGGAAREGRAGAAG